MPFLQNDTQDTLIIRSIRKEIPSEGGVKIKDEQTDNADVVELIDRGWASLHANASKADAKDVTEEASTASVASSDTGEKSTDEKTQTSGSKTSSKSSSTRSTSKAASKSDDSSDTSTS